MFYVDHFQFLIQFKQKMRQLALPREFYDKIFSLPLTVARPMPRSPEFTNLLFQLVYFIYTAAEKKKQLALQPLFCH
jgi:hypothetical protein